MKRAALTPSGLLLLGLTHNDTAPVISKYLLPSPKGAVRLASLMMC